MNLGKKLLEKIEELKKQKEQHGSEYIKPEVSDKTFKVEAEIYKAESIGYTIGKIKITNSEPSNIGIEKRVERLKERLDGFSDGCTELYANEAQIRSKPEKEQEAIHYKEAIISHKDNHISIEYQAKRYDRKECRTGQETQDVLKRDLENLIEHLKEVIS